MWWMLLLLGCQSEVEGWDWLLCAEEDDFDGDWVTDHLTTYRYDEHGRQLLEVQDEWVDGQPELIVYQTWEEHGWLATYALDGDGDGVLDFVQRYAYDSEGHLLSRLLDVDGDGQDDIWYEATWEGDLLRVEEEGEVGVEEHLTRQTHTYDQRDLLVLTTIEHTDSSLPDYRYVYTYDERGFLVQTLAQTGVDHPWYTVTFTRDDHGEILDQWWDHDADDARDHHYHWDRDADGLPLAYALDQGADGSVDLRTWWTYDDQGQQLSEEWDSNADGLIDRRSSWAWDEWGHNTHQTVDTDMDGVPDHRTTLVWAEACE